jgi:hypothetical protein
MIYDFDMPLNFGIQWVNSAYTWDCDQTAMGLPPVTATVFLIAK